MSILFARAVALLTLIVIVAGSAWTPAFGPEHPLPEWAAIPPALKLTLALLAPALALASADITGPARQLAAAGAGLGVVVLLSWAVTAALGTPAVLAGIGADSVLAKLLALRPSLLTALGVTALGWSIGSRSPAIKSFDGSALLGTVAGCVFFLVGVGHLYGAAALTAGPDAMVSASTGLGSALLFALALAALAAHPGGPLAIYAGDGPGAIAKRRLLPAAVVTPIGSGFLLLYALTGQQLSPTLAVALTVFVNVLVMLVLINGAGNKVARVAQDRQARLEAREALAKKQGMRDAMTALLNRRGWDTHVQTAERRCKAEELNACIVVIDMDGLKQINDTKGHQAGDAHIQRAAAALRQAARRGDTLARLGGDEFAYLAVGCDETSARAVVERFQESLRANKVSASVGYAMRDERTIAQAFAEADQAMYQQKRARKLKRA